MVIGATDDYSHHHPGPADAVLIVEISESSLRQDQGKKAAMYAMAGVADYWIVNIRGRTLEVRRQPQGGEYRSVSIYSEADAIAPLAAPDSPVRVASLLPLKRSATP